MMDVPRPCQSIPQQSYFQCINFDEVNRQYTTETLGQGYRTSSACVPREPITQFPGDLGETLISNDLLGPSQSRQMSYPNTEGYRPRS